MKTTKHIGLLLLFSLFFLACDRGAEKHDYQLFYDQPATNYEEALMLGNGTMGVTVFGGLGSDTIFLNDANLWSEEAVDPYMNSEAYKVLLEIREVLFAEDYAKADDLNKNLQETFFQSFIPLGNLLIEFDHDTGYSDYYRELDFSDADAKVEYVHEDVHYSREYFVSNPDGLMLIKLKADKERALDFKLDFSSLLPYNVVVDEASVTVNGYAPYHIESPDCGDMSDTVVFDEEREMRFTAIIELRECDGDIAYSDSGLSVSGATDAVLAISIATSFNGYDKDPLTEGKNCLALANRKIRKASSKTYDEMKARHEEDYHSFISSLEL